MTLGFLLGFAAGPAGAIPNPDGVEKFAFDVWLDSRRIGEHTFTLAREDDGLQVDSEARYRVKLGFVTLFRYDHNATEQWHDGCIERLEARTLVDGERVAVVAERPSNNGNDGLLLHREGDGDTGQVAVDGCLATYAYWDRERMQGGRLLNPQTGQVAPATLSALGPLPLPGGGEPAQAFALQTPDAEIKLWYGAGDEWLALQTLTKGRTLTYLRQSLSVSL